MLAVSPGQLCRFIERATNFYAVENFQSDFEAKIMTNESSWVSAARKRQIMQGTIPANIAELEDLSVQRAVARILGPKAAPDAPDATPEPEQPTKSEQRRKDRREAERARRFGRG